MADYFDSAREQIEAQKRAALDAVAAAGTAGRKAHEDEIARIQASRQQAIQAALAGAAQRGVPDALAGQLEQQIGGGYDRQADNLRTSMSQRDAGLGQIRAANESYFAQADAALPGLKARADRQLGDIRAKAEQEEADREMRLQLQEMQLQKAGLDLQGTRASVAAKAAKAAGGGDLSDSELERRLRGAADARVAAAPVKMPARIMGLKLPQLSQTARARSIGVEAGIDPARVFGVVQPPKTAAPAKAKPLTAAQQVADMEAKAKLARMKIYDTAKRAASPATFKQFETALNPDANGGVDPLDYVASLSDGDLRKAGISRKALTDWVSRYMAI